jgi:hypothetical protein
VTNSFAPVFKNCIEIYFFRIGFQIYIHCIMFYSLSKKTNTINLLSRTVIKKQLYKVLAVIGHRFYY